MNNETIKNYQEITVAEAGEMLRDNGWKPINDMAFRDFRDLAKDNWYYGVLDSINTDPQSLPFGDTSCGFYKQCAKVTEIDPCKAPDGCPELEPWMAYVGTALFPTSILTPNYSAAHYVCDKIEWICGYGCRTRAHKAIDVRTEWAQEHFPEHCRIRNYQEPDAFDGWIYRHFNKTTFSETSSYVATGESLRDLYELGQANAK